MHADALSRLPMKLEDLELDLDDYRDDLVAISRSVNINQINTFPVTCDHLRRSTQLDPTLGKVLEYVLHEWPSGVDRDSCLWPCRLRRAEPSVENGCLLWGIRFLIPAKLQQEVTADLHTGHPGVVRMKSLARLYAWCPGMDKALEDMVRDCEGCLSTQRNPPRAPLNPWEWPVGSWQRVHIDLAGPFLGSMFLVTIDAHSK